MTQKRDVEGMGTPEIKYGESMCFVQHASTGLWLTYAAVDAKSARLGPLKRKVKQNYTRWSAKYKSPMSAGATITTQTHLTRHELYVCTV